MLPLIFEMGELAEVNAIEFETYPSGAPERRISFMTSFSKGDGTPYKFAAVAVPKLVLHLRDF